MPRVRMSPLQALKAGFMACAAPGVFFLASISAHAASGEVADLVNTLRSAPSKCAGRPGLQQLKRRSELDEAAARMAAGSSLKDSARATGYESVAVRGLSLMGSTDLKAMETLLANGYCPLIVEPDLAEIGVHQQGTTTWVMLASAFAPAEGLSEQAIDARMLKLVNQARSVPRTCGDKRFPAAGPVALNPVLARAARAHSEDMARNNFFSHTSLDGAEPHERVEQAGYDYRSTAENIAAGQMSPEEAMAAWIASPGHCANLMDAAYTEMGVALSNNRRSRLGAYWTQVFGAPRVTRGARATKTGQGL